MPSGAGLKLEAIGKQFANGTVALARVDLALDPGEVCALIGPSGGGKTTLLRVIAGLEAPTAGRVWIGAREVTDLPAHERDVALVFEGGALWSMMTARDNLAFGPRVRAGRLGALGWCNRLLHPARFKAQERELDARIEEVARVLGIERMLARRPRDLSAGERQRVALGRALVRRPKLLLLDEPLVHLPPDEKQRLRGELATIFRGLDACVIHVTHDHDEAWALADRVGVLLGGTLRQVGSRAELTRNPADSQVAQFLGRSSASPSSPDRPSPPSLLPPPSPPPSS